VICNNPVPDCSEEEVRSIGECFVVRSTVAISYSGLRGRAATRDDAWVGGIEDDDHTQARTPSRLVFVSPYSPCNYRLTRCIDFSRYVDHVARRHWFSMDGLSMDYTQADIRRWCCPGSQRLLIRGAPLTVVSKLRPQSLAVTAMFSNLATLG
jgi:hypothetical protein